MIAVRLVHARRCFPHHRLGACRIVVLHQVHSAAHLIPPHQHRVERLQQVADRVGFLHAGVEPQVVGIVGEDDGQAVIKHLASQSISFGRKTEPRQEQ